MKVRHPFPIWHPSRPRSRYNHQRKHTLKNDLRSASPPPPRMPTTRDTTGWGVHALRSTQSAVFSIAEQFSTGMPLFTFTPSFPRPRLSGGSPARLSSHHLDTAISSPHSRRPSPEPRIAGATQQPPPRQRQGFSDGPPLPDGRKETLCFCLLREIKRRSKGSGGRRPPPGGHGQVPTSRTSYTTVSGCAPRGEVGLQVGGQPMPPPSSTWRPSPVSKHRPW